MDGVFNRRILVYFFFIFFILFIYYIYVDFSSFFEVKNYALYIEEDNSLLFVNSIFDIEKNDKYDGKVITEVYSDIEGLVSFNSESVPWSNYSDEIKSVYVIDEIQPISTAYWFYNFSNCNYLNLYNLDMSYVTELNYMFYNTGYDVEELVIEGLSNWDTSNAIVMGHMFYNTGKNANVVDVGTLENWDVSDVLDMSYMFSYMALNSKQFSLGNLSKWNTSNVTDMSYMFRKTGYEVKIKLDVSNWNVRNVTSYDGFNKYMKESILEPKWND